MLTIHFDGLCEPKNPGGYACYGYIITRKNETLTTGKGSIRQLKPGGFKSLKTAWGDSLTPSA